jgi:copper chaperone
MARAVVSVSGMKCDACEKLIHDALMEKPGVIEAKADFKAQCVEIDYDETKVELEVLKQIIADKGFKVAGLGHPPQQTLIEKIKALLAKLLAFFKS